jgi:hypothetical protein
MGNFMELLDKLKCFILPEVKVDDERRTYKIVTEGMFFNNITELFYVIRGYRKAEDNEDYSI